MLSGGGKWAPWFGLCSAVLFAARESRADDREEVVSITVSPFHAFVPMLELQGEYKVIDGFGVSLIGGYGVTTQEVEDETGDEIDVDFAIWELGTQLTWYPLQRFRSLQLGAEAIWINVSADNVGVNNASGYANGLAVGPFVGFKFIVGPGFTGFIQGGVTFLTIDAEASDDTGDTESQSDSAVGLLLNLNVGWSF